MGKPLRSGHLEHREGSGKITLTLILRK